MREIEGLRDQMEREHRRVMREAVPRMILLIILAGLTIAWFLYNGGEIPVEWIR